VVLTTRTGIWLLSCRGVEPDSDPDNDDDDNGGDDVEVPTTQGTWAKT
jgi:hypothetical protein